jgi:methylthioribose-1-phosphate isomerase
VDELIDAIESLAIRGAPALGVAGALGVALSAVRHRQGGHPDRDAVQADAARIAATRPTAVNLDLGVRRALSRLTGGTDAVLAEGLLMLDEDERMNSAAARRAADLLKHFPK